MSDLLQKRSNNLKRPSTIQPKQTFEMPKSDWENHRDKKKKRKDSTTVRVSSDVKHKLNALVTLGVADNVDTLIDIISDEYISAILTNDEKKQLKFMQDIYVNKLKGQKE